MEKLNITWLDIFVTERCNLRCKYCFHNKRPVDMPEETVDRAIEFLGPMFGKTVTFNLFGGEPFMRPDLCFSFMNKLKEKFPECKFHISTNGTNFNQDLVRALRSYNSMLQISYDGIDQEELRGQSKLVEENIPKFIKEFSPLNPAIRLTYTRDTVGNIYQSFLKCVDLGVKKFTHQAQLTNEWISTDFEIYRGQLEKIHDYMDDHKDIYVHFCDCEKITKQKDNAICSAGKTLIALTANGDLYPCHRMIKMDKFKIGNVFEGTLNRGGFAVMGILGCRDCVALPTCHPCIAANYEYTGSFMKPLRATCEINKIEHIMSEMRYTRLNKDILDSQDMIRSMVLVLTDLRNSNNEILEVLRNEKPIN